MSLLIILYIFSQSPDSIPKTKPPNQHTIGEELITGEAEMKITDQKIFIAPEINPIAPIKEMLSVSSYILDPGFFHSIDSLSVPQQFTHSSFLRIPVERSFVYGDILIFLPSFESRVANWELVIANSLGETVRRLGQKGHPPALITWDGKNDKGEPIPTGDIYSFTFNAYDAQGNMTRISCEPQLINAIIWQQGDGWVASIAADHIYSTGEAQLNEQALGRLDEIANVIKERFKKEVIVYVYSEEEALSLERCRVIEKELRQRLILPKDALRVVPKFIPGLKPKHSKIEIHIN